LKILILGANQKHNIEYTYAQHLNALENVTCEIFPSYEKYAEIINRNIVNKIINRLAVNLLLKSLNSEIVNFVKLYRPEIIWVFKGMEIMPKTIIELKKLGCKLINYNPDHPFVFSGPGSGNMNVTQSFKLYDYHFTYNLTLKKQIELEYNFPTFLLPFGYELNDFQYNKAIDVQEINRVCFIGNPDKKRIKFIEFLLNNNVNLTLFGHGWESKLKNKKKCEIFDAVYHDELWLNLRKYRIQLNIFREHNEGSHNMRTFEVPVIGGIQLAPDTKEHRLFFESDKEIFLYNTVEECVNKINYLLSLSTEQANQYRTYAREACIKNKHSYKDRAQQVLAVLEKL
jgi:spore maturation protein CgeB